jgi:hypothetical protein
MIAGALVADLLSGTPQAVFLGVCLTVMAVGIVASITKPSLEPDMPSAAMHIEAKLAATARAAANLRLIEQPARVRAAAESSTQRVTRESKVIAFH